LTAERVSYALTPRDIFVCCRELWPDRHLTMFSVPLYIRWNVPKSPSQVKYQDWLSPSMLLHLTETLTWPYTGRDLPTEPVHETRPSTLVLEG
jgi:hypothetical protein